MAKFRLKMLPVNLLALIGLMAWGASASSPSADESTPSPSPLADVELICHTDNPAECYPKVFQPTHEFQVVHPDQDLPLGLHVRLNVYTGLKEAKINVPDEHDPALEGLPVDSSVVIVERDQTEPDQAQVKLPPNAPVYDSAGKVKEPKSADPTEGSAFYKSLTILKKGLDVDGALEMLEEISHDIYYGLKIAEDYDTVQELFCLSTAPPSSDNPQSTTRARLASLTLASTTQNNPKALAELANHWPKLSTTHCSSARTPLGTSIFTLLPDSTSSSNGQEEVEADASLTKARISLLTGLLKSPLFRTHFLTSPGPSHLLRILTTKTTTTPSWASAQRSAAFLLLDNFLDADMGATLGEWPSGSKTQLSSSECTSLHKGGGEGKRGMEGREEECLDWLVAKLRETHARDKEHWSHELAKKIREAGKRNNGKARGMGEKVEL
jgi:nucleotide exchange factor SIL1